MAGYRLAPVAARARRYPRHRRRVVVRSRGADQTISVGTALETDAAQALLYVPKTVAVGTAYETDSAVAIAATGQNAGQAGLVWFWQAGAPASSVAVGTAYETDSAPSVTFTGAQAFALGVARETDTAFAVASSPADVIVITERRHRAYRYRRRGGEW